MFEEPLVLLKDIFKTKKNYLNNQQKLTPPPLS